MNDNYGVNRDASLKILFGNACPSSVDEVTLHYNNLSICLRFQYSAVLLLIYLITCSAIVKSIDEIRIYVYTIITYLYINRFNILLSYRYRVRFRIKGPRCIGKCSHILIC
jgi:hypothetical protein